MDQTLYEETIDNQTLSRLDRLAKDTLTIEVRRSEQIIREASVAKKVGEAKGRLLARQEVDAVLNQLQEEAHTRTVGAFEDRLTAFANDVLPELTDSHKIKLKLRTERNLPALDILVTNNGSPEKITSGALVDITSTGLRFITLARSGIRKFIVLDEADKHIKEENIKEYFSVVNELSKEANVQTIIITHHDLTDFYDDFRVYEIANTESTDRFASRVPVLISEGNMVARPGQEDHLKWMELKSFEAYENARIEFSPGVTAIVGQNMYGKSAWSRALKTFIGSGEELMVRNDASGLEVNLGLSDDRVLQYQRVRKGNPIARYRLHSPESWKANDLKTVPPLHDNPGADLPDWVAQETGLSTADGIDVQFWGQIKNSFMIDETPAKRASLLSVGRESGVIIAMNEIYKEDLKSDNTTVKTGELEISSIRASLESTNDIEWISKKIEEMKITVGKILQEREILDGLDQELRNFQNSANDLKRLYAQLQSIKVPDTPEIALSDWLDASILEFKTAEIHSGNKLAQVSSTPDMLATDEIDRSLELYQNCITLSSIRIIPPSLLSDLQLGATDEIDVSLDEFYRLSAISKTRLSSDFDLTIPQIIKTEGIDIELAEYQRAFSESALRVAEFEFNAPTFESGDLDDEIAVFREEEKNLAEFTATIASTNASIHIMKAEMQSALDDLGNKCPLCKNDCEVNMILGDSPNQHNKNRNHP